MRGLAKPVFMDDMENLGVTLCSADGRLLDFGRSLIPVQPLAPFCYHGFLPPHIGFVL